MRRREAADTATPYAFDLIEHDGEDMRNRPFLDRKAALARLLRNAEARILLTHRAGRSCRLRARLPAWRRGHRFEEGFHRA
jgi:ATP-dependent DNA ligase